MKNRTPIIISAILLAGIVAFFGIRYLLFTMDWKLLSSVSSPNNEFTIKHYRSLSEAGQAPYGDNIFIEFKKSILWSTERNIFFAGYCSAPVKFKWASNNRIVIECITDAPIHTQALTQYGIEVEVITK